MAVIKQQRHERIDVKILLFIFPVAMKRKERFKKKEFNIYDDYQTQHSVVILGKLTLQ